MNSQNQSKFSDKGISTPIGILIIVVCAILLGGILVWQIGVFKKEAEIPEVKVTEETKTPEEKISKIDWEILMPEIRSALKKEASEMGFKEDAIEERGPISIYKQADITGDGIDEVIVSWGTGGAYMGYFSLMRIKNEKPITARFREEDGKISPTMFLAGASVRHGAGVEMLPDKKAVYSITWSTDDFGKMESCGASVYHWNINNELFEFDKNLSKEISEKEC